MSTNVESLENYVNFKLREDIFIKRAVEKGVMSIDCVKVVETLTKYFINVTVINKHDNSRFNSAVTIHDDTQIKLGVNNVISQVEQEAQEALVIML